MKKIAFLIGTILFMAGSVWASPFLVCDPYPTTTVQPTHFNLVIDGGTAFDVAAYKNTDNSVILYYNLSTITNGSHTITVKAVVIDPLWGRAESASVPFAFVKPVVTSPLNPANIRLRIN